MNGRAGSNEIAGVVGKWGVDGTSSTLRVQTSAKSLGHSSNMGKNSMGKDKTDVDRVLS